MPQVTLDHVLGFLDGRIFQWRQAHEEACDSWAASRCRGRMDAYEDLKAYILIESADPE
jgi:hypothetical protein